MLTGASRGPARTAMKVLLQQFDAPCSRPRARASASAGAVATINA